MPMATNDTDPQRTEPGGPPDDAAAPSTDAGTDSAADAAASLLAGLADSSQPEDVKETEGHVAAAYAAAPHRPPRANDKTVENPAVFINATVPLQPPPSSGRVKLGPPAPSVVSMNGAPTVVGGPRLYEQTDPGERTRNQTRVILASIGGVVLAALIAITILALMRPRQPANTVEPTPSPTTEPSPSVASSPVSPPQVTSTIAPPSAIVAPSAAAATTTTTTTTTTATAPKTTTPAHGRPHPGSSTSPRPSGTFAEPDRHL